MNVSFPMPINAPWGNFICQNYVDFFKQCRAQLEWYLENGTPDRAYTTADRDAYDELIALNCDKTAECFLIEKQTAKLEGRRYKNNWAVIKAMKAKGLWCAP